MKTSPARQAQSGFTLLELVFTVVVLTILTRVAMVKLQTPATLTLQSQAQTVAETIRQAQSLAMARGERMKVNVSTSGSNGAVAVACVASAPCGTDKTVSAQQGVVVGVNPTALYFNNLGQPINSTGVPLATDATFTLSFATGNNTATFTVTVAALTGRVSVSPS